MQSSFKSPATAKQQASVSMQQCNMNEDQVQFEAFLLFLFYCRVLLVVSGVKKKKTEHHWWASCARWDFDQQGQGGLHQRIPTIATTLVSNTGLPVQNRKSEDQQAFVNSGQRLSQLKSQKSFFFPKKKIVHFNTENRESAHILIAMQQIWSFTDRASPTATLRLTRVHAALVCEANYILYSKLREKFTFSLRQVEW